MEYFNLRSCVRIPQPSRHGLRVEAQIGLAWTPVAVGNLSLTGILLERLPEMVSPIEVGDRLFLKLQLQNVCAELTGVVRRKMSGKVGLQFELPRPYELLSPPDPLLHIVTELQRLDVINRLV